MPIEFVPEDAFGRSGYVIPRDQFEQITAALTLPDLAARAFIPFVLPACVWVAWSDADAVEALSAMRHNGASRMMVVDDGKLVGIISLKDMMKWLSLKMDLEE